MNEKNVLIIGLGEVGKAIKRIEEEAENVVYVIDKMEPDNKPCCVNSFDVMHICFPYTKEFINDAVDYINQYPSKIIIVHSTVPAGTTRKIAEGTAEAVRIVHSFIRGMHPDLVPGILTFTKPVGGDDISVQLAMQHLLLIGIKCRPFKNYETSELAKLLSTAYYGYNILFAKQAKKICNELDLDYEEVYIWSNEDYNQGYTQLGRPNVVRPVLYPPPEKIGGHCVSRNFELLPECDLKTFCLEQNNKK